MSWQLRAQAEIERRRRTEQETPASTFTAKYHDDPAAFVRDCFRWRPGEGASFYQEEILEALARKRRACVRGPHGLGKTALNAWAVLWFALTRDAAGEDWKAPTTASAWRQLDKFLWPEIRKWARRLDWSKIGRGPFKDRTEQLDLSLKLPTGEAFALASDNPALIEGAHAAELLYVFDESKEIQPGAWDSAEGAFSTGSVYWLATSTPGEPQGRFYEIQSRRLGYDDWWVRAVTLAETIQAGRVSSEWAEQRKRQWGEASAVFQNRVKGDFAASDEDGVIPLAWIELANERWYAWKDAGSPGVFVGTGVDVARYGPDKTVQALRYDGTLAERSVKAVSELRRTSREDTMTTVGRVKGVLDAHGGKAVVDVIGIGAGVVDRLRELGCEVVAFNAAEHTDRKDRSGELGFTNVRGAAWWNLREMLDPANGDPAALPPDDMLTGDLTAPHWRVVSGGKIEVESKDKIRERLGRSTDDGDAVVQIMDGGYHTADDWIAAMRAEQKPADPFAGLAPGSWDRPRPVGAGV